MSITEATTCWTSFGMVGVPMPEPESFSCSDPKVPDAQTRNSEAIKHSWAMHSNVPEMKRVATTVREEREGILNWFSSRATNAILEGLNSVIQSMKRAARGFRNVEYFRTAIFLRLGGLDFSARAALGIATH